MGSQHYKEELKLSLSRNSLQTLKIPSQPEDKMNIRDFNKLIMK